MPDMVKNYGLPIFNMIENYIYLYHIDKYIILPSFVDSVSDSQPATFAVSNPLARSAPIYSYSYSGPRRVQVNFNLHRELMYQINRELNQIPTLNPNEDYVDLFIKYIQAASLPSYKAAAKMVNPPIVALRLGNDIFIKGVVEGGVGITYQYPILEDGRYALVSINFSVSEMDPYDANTVLTTGSFRSVSLDLERKNVIIEGDSGYSSFGDTGRANTVNTQSYSTIDNYVKKKTNNSRLSEYGGSGRNFGNHNFSGGGGTFSGSDHNFSGVGGTF